MRSLLLAVVFASPSLSQEVGLASARPVLHMQVLPLPHSQSSFQLDGKELTAAHYDAADMRPFFYPIMTSQGVCLTRMGHPHDPVTHSHHNSVWFAHSNINGIDFWGDHAKEQGRIITKTVDRYEDGDSAAVMQMTNHWVKAADNSVQLIEIRRCEVRPLDGLKSWFMILDAEFSAPKGMTTTFGTTFFGLCAVRVAKTIDVNDGGGRILNSEGQLNEPQIFRKPARWCDYSGRITNNPDGFAGITLMNHPSNPQNPTAFHVRSDGWMGACLTPEKEIQVTDTEKLRVRYGLWVHDGVATQAQSEAQWQAFVALPPADFAAKK